MADILNIHIYAPVPDVMNIHAGVCPDCKRHTRFILFTFAFHGTNATCLRCGREWSDGECQPLPFERGIRQKNIASAKKWWRTYTEMKKNEVNNG